MAIESGKTFRSSVGMSKELLALFLPCGWATGDVRR